MPSAAYGRVPFKEQIAFFRRKVALPSDSWTQLYGAGHDHGFVVAGANREALIKDFMQSVDQAIDEGRSLASFQRDFDHIVQAHGWDYHGSRNWRSKVIYETNLLSSFSAGRREQLLAMTGTHPYWMYVHSDAVEHPRPAHLALDGLVLRHDDPFWRTHFPPNGWGCQCSVRALTKRQAIKLGKVRDDGEPVHNAPPVRMREVTIGKNGPTPRTVKVPVGIDPGFEHAPGATSRGGWMTQRATQAVRDAPDLTASRWQPVITSTPADLGRPARLPLFKPPVPLAAQPRAGQSMVAQVADAIGASSKTFDVQGLPVTINAQALGAHLAKDVGRAQYLPLLPDLLTRPWEVWVNLFRDRVSGAYELRARVIKAYALGDGRGMLAVAQAGGGFFESWTFIPTSDLGYINRQRIGKLWYGSPEQAL